MTSRIFWGTIAVGGVVALGVGLHFLSQGGQLGLLEARSTLPSSVRITAAGTANVAALLRQNPRASVPLMLPRKKDQNFPVAIVTRNHGAGSVSVTLRERLNHDQLRVIALGSRALTKPGSYTISVRPTVSPATLASGSRYIVRATLAMGSGATATTVTHTVPATVTWKGAAQPTSKSLFATLSEIDGVGIPLPETRDETTAVTIDRGFCIPAAYTQRVPDMTFTMTLQQKTEDQYTTVAKVEGGSSETGLHRENMDVLVGGTKSGGVTIRSIDEKTLPDGAYRLVLDAVKTSDGKKSRDIADLSVSFNKIFQPFCR